MTISEGYESKGIKLSPAGIWERDAETGKKHPIVAYRKDGLEFANYPKDNIAKCRIEDIIAPEGYRVIVIDADSQEGKEKVLKLFPQAVDTFSTRTSSDAKRHFFFYVPKDKFDELRAIGIFVEVDLLSYGILFEAHFFREDDYEMPDFSKDILTLDEAGQELLLESLDTKSVSFKSNGEHTSFVNKEMAFLVENYVAGELDIMSDDPVARLNRNKLFKQLTPKSQKKKGQRKFEAPKLSHDSLNTMALLVAKNSKIPNEVAIQFIEKLLVELYGVDLNSKETHNHWYNSILPTLPFFERIFNSLEDFREFDEVLEQNTTDNTKDANFKWALFTTAKNGTTKYFQINKFTYRLRSINGSVFFDESYIRKLYPNLTKDDLEDIPHLALMTDPYKEVVEFDEDNDIYLLNTMHPSRYKANAIARKDKPDNVLTKMINKFFDNQLHEEFYYHWLAHLVYGDKPVNVVVWFCSDANAKAGTGKTLLSAALPAQLMGDEQATTVDSSVADAGWGQMYDTRLLSYNDLNKMKDSEWARMYAKIKDEASNSTSKIRNNKGGDVVKSSVGICQSGSSNFIPSVDASDRRFFIVSPKLQLDENGADELHRIFEAERNKEHEEVQEIADYLAYLYKNEADTYKEELFTRAIKTEEKISATQMGAYTHTIISRISYAPKELFDIFKEPTSYSDTWQDWQIIEFIKVQSINGKVYLPIKFLNMLINRVKGIDEERSPASIMSILEMKKTRIREDNARFLQPHKLKNFPSEVATYKLYGVETDINEEAYKNFMPEKLSPEGIHRLVGGL